MPDIGQKRKRPPTFQHFPVKRAKKLKKVWVETAKIKSKWKAHKRREGIAPPHSDLPPPSGELDVQNVDEADEDGSHSEISNDPTSAENSEMQDENAAHSPPPPPGSPRRRPPGTNSSPPKEKSNNRKPRLSTRYATSGGGKPSLRELFQKAYSKSSLHTHKSDPLKRRRGDHARNGGQGASGASASRGKGQPDMKLRMNAMLEKIKRNYS